MIALSSDLTPQFEQSGLEYLSFCEDLQTLLTFSNRRPYGRCRKLLRQRI